ncbi:carboxylate--amine ligase [Fulvitalea axinellae]|uniref:Carboxylate--amine ligase n=2 Tax=Fulvitalea axinellae TaxID=1182444 RepID=A0AAU9D1K2_9BACT|nr:carboxylate--amine ligase [Fulvitalea axinellae]
MHMGGLFRYSKGEALELLPEKYLPKTRRFDERPENAEFYKTDFDFPFICKPDFGERGKGVWLVRNEGDWKKIYSELDEPFMLQEFVEDELEFGIFYYRILGVNSGVFSVTAKGFLSAVGDGESTLKELIQSNMRAVGREEYLFDRFSSELDRVLPKGETLVLEQIGNHCRGTEFIDANHLINDQLVKVFDEITKDIKGFHYGRFDLKVRSLEDLYKGETIKVVELNGVNSEATHIYGQNFTLGKAYAVVLKQHRLAYEVAKKNLEHGFKPQPLSTFVKELYAHLRS